MKQRILITGISGFVGTHLTDALLQNKKYQIYGTVLHAPKANNQSIHIFKGDLRNPSFLAKVVGESMPEYVIHLAAQASVAESFENPRKTLEENFFIELNLLEALKKNPNLKKILIVSSSDVYGDVDVKLLPISEKQLLAPNSPYAVSKVLQEDLAKGYHAMHNLPIVILRPFGHIGPGQNGKAIASFVEKIKKAKSNDTLAVGNIAVKRDFCDVRDIVAAYIVALEKAKIGETYNLGAGRSYKLSEILDELIAVSNKNLKITIDKNLLRPHDIMETVCDYSKFHNATGWEPQIPITKTLKDMMGGSV